MSESGTSPKVKSRRKTANRRKRKNLPLFHVVLLDDNDHTHEYVIEMVRSLFGYPTHEGFRLACEVDTHKRAVLLTTHKEVAELKRDQVHAFGCDPRVPTCCGSMSAVLVPAD